MRGEFIQSRPNLTSSLKTVTFAGPAGRLEGLWKEAAGARLGSAVFAHPHPLHGGTLHNKVVFRAARALAAAGYGTLRFNFRGVGLSRGGGTPAGGKWKTSAPRWTRRSGWAAFRSWPAASPSGRRPPCARSRETGASSRSSRPAFPSRRNRERICRGRASRRSSSRESETRSALRRFSAGLAGGRHGDRRGAGHRSFLRREARRARAARSRGFSRHCRRRFRSEFRHALGIGAARPPLARAPARSRPISAALLRPGSRRTGRSRSGRSAPSS